MRGVHALVAEVAVDLEHLLDATHEAALEEELGRDAQVEIKVEGVHMRGERTSRGTTVNGLQHRSLHLEESVFVEGAAQRGDRTGTIAHHVANLLVGDHADVRLARAGVFVEFLMQRRQRLQRLGGDGPLIGEDRQLAGLRCDHTTFDEQVVAQIHQLLELLERIRADLLLREHGLDRRAIAGGELHEAQSARIANEQHAARHADDVVGLGARFELAVILDTHGVDGRGDVEIHRVRIDTVLDHHRTLGHTGLHLLRVRERSEFLVRRIHGLVERGALLHALENRLVLVEQHFRAFHGAHLGGGHYLFFHSDVCRFIRFSHSATV